LNHLEEIESAVRDLVTMLGVVTRVDELRLTWQHVTYTDSDVALMCFEAIAWTGFLLVTNVLTAKKSLLISIDTSVLHRYLLHSVAAQLSAHHM